MNLVKEEMVSEGSAVISLLDRNFVDFPSTFSTSSSTSSSTFDALDMLLKKTCEDGKIKAHHKVQQQSS